MASSVAVTDVSCVCEKMGAVPCDPPDLQQIDLQPAP